MSLKKNIISNFIGSMWQALMGLLFIPFYINFMGIESWGIIGFFITLQVILSLVDLGLSSTLNRELARLSVLPNVEHDMNNLVRTLEIIYWCIAFLIGIIFLLLSPYIAHYWIKAEYMHFDTIENALNIIGFVIALQMLIVFYSNGLLGLQKHVLLNIINASMNTLRWAGVVVVLWLISPTIQAFFIWHIIINIVNLILLAMFLWRSLPYCEQKTSFQKRLLFSIWRFAAGVSGITILSVILTQLDKVILSKLLTLEMFGYYSLASAVAMSLGRLISPVFIGTYPRLTQLVSLNDKEGLKCLYQRSCQLMSVLLLPLTIIIAVFSYDILLLWTHSTETAQKTRYLLSILICGTALNGLMHIPYALQLAHGWTKFAFLITLLLTVVFIPSIVILTELFGAIGSAYAWLFLNIFYMAIGVPLTHNRLIKGETRTWFRNLMYPLAGVSAVVLTGYYIIITHISTEFIVISIAVTFIIAAVVATLLARDIKLIVFHFVTGGHRC